MNKGQTQITGFPPDLLSPSIPARLMGLLYRWGEWRSVAGSPRPASLPEPVKVWGVRGGEVVALAEGVCLERSTAPKGTSRIEEFNLAFWDLAPDQRFYVSALVDCQGQPWMKGKWENVLEILKLTPRDYVLLLNDALKALRDAAKRRGLV